MTDLKRLEKKYYKIATKTVNDKLKKGILPHSKHILCPPGMKATVKMFRWTEFETVMELRSEPFDTLHEAQHFADCFNDNFLYDAYCKEENGNFRVYTGWIRKIGFLSYAVASKGEYFEFSNGS